MKAVLVALRILGTLALWWPTVGCFTEPTHLKVAETEGNVDQKVSEPAPMDFPAEMVSFEPHPMNPIFSGTGTDTWDRKIRERGYILRERDQYHLWYTGYHADSGMKLLGYATSTDGIEWARHPNNPLYRDDWVEDMCVVKHHGVYYMFAEGRDDVAHMLTSNDRINWEDQGSLDIRYLDGRPLSPGPYGTPTVWVEGDTWYLFYERNDEGVWLASSSDRRSWVNVQDDPVLSRGPEPYDRHAVALNQIVRHEGKYFAYYHASAHLPWKDWSTNVAVSGDLVHWEKYPKNPIVTGDKSSGIVVRDGRRYRLYTMHPDVRAYFPKD